MATARHTAVIGGGIAGLSVAWLLARRGRRVTLFEREPAPGTHSTARNAQIWLPVDPDETTGPLAQRSAALMTGLTGGEEAWLVRSGALVLMPPGADAAALFDGAERGGVEARRVTRDELARRSPAATGVPDHEALSIDGAGVLDPHSMTMALARAARDAGAALRTSRGVRSIDAAGSRVRGVTLDDGEEVESDEVVIAAGAWAGALGAAVGAPVPLVPLRRHLVLLEASPLRAGTIVWRFGDAQVYWRPESGGVLASPCDEEPVDPSLPAADPAALEALAIALEPVAPELVDAPVRTKWACLRTYAHDRELVVGPDPRVEGLAWLGGLGGRGMTIGVAAAEVCARAMDGDPDRVAELGRPERPQPDTLQAP